MAIWTVLVTALLLLHSGLTEHSRDHSGESESCEDGQCSSNWTYQGENGQKKWGAIWPACKGKNQSPINIDTSKVQSKDFPSLSGNLFDAKPISFIIRNDKYTVTVKPNISEPLCVKNLPLAESSDFCLNNLQFSWGSSTHYGSEHTINGNRYPLECRIQFYNTKYGSYEKASGEEQGLATISIVFTLHEQGDAGNKGIWSIANLLHKIEEPGEEAVCEEPLVLKSLLDNIDINDYFAYKGSLTTPPCTENVIWLIYISGIGVTDEQMKKFQEVNVASNNFRWTQSLNGRTVVDSSKSSHGHCKCNKESTHSASRLRRVSTRN